MPRQPLTDRLQALLKRVFFWLPNGEEATEQSPDTLHDHALVLAVVAPVRVPRWKQFRYAMRIFSSGERRVLAVCGAAATISLCLAGLWYFYQSTGVVPAVGGVFVEGLTGQPKYLNPIDAVANDVDRDIARLIYSGLFRYEADAAVPDIAESYAWSDDNKTLTVTLRSDARFHDGMTVTSDDVRFTYESVQDPARKSPMLPLYRELRVETSGDRTVIFRLESPDVNLLGRLTLGILPAHLWGDVPVGNVRLSDLNIKPIGSGPYRVRSFSREGSGLIRSYTLERFEQYYGLKPYIKTLTMQFFADKSEALEAFKSDQVDAVAFVSTSDAGKIASSARKQRIRLELPEETVAFLNVKHPVLSNKDVRKALIMAIDRSELVSALRDDAEPIYGPFPFGSATPTVSDIEAARTLLTSAGWVLPEGGSVRVKQAPKKPPAPAPKTAAQKAAAAAAAAEPEAVPPPQEFEVTISVPAEADLITMAETLKRRWSLLGAKVTVRPASLNEVVQAAVRDRNTAMVTLLNVFLGAEQDIFPFWWSGQAVERGLNLSGLADRALDTELEHLHNATSTETLAAARSAAAQTISDAAAAAFLVRPVYNYLLSADIKGVPPHMVLTMPAERYQGVAGWYRKTAWRWK